MKCRETLLLLPGVDAAFPGETSRDHESAARPGGYLPYDGHVKIDIPRGSLRDSARASALAWSRRPAAIEPAGAAPGLIAVPLTTDPGSESYPTLSPDGSQVAFSWEGSREDNVDIYLKLVGPGEPHRLTTDPAANFSPAWSPDGRQIAFLRRLAVGDFGRCDLYLTPALGGAERRLAEIDLTEFHTAAGVLARTPDGKWLAAAGRFGRGPSEIWLLSPDERSILFSKIDSHGSDLMMVENLR